MAVFGTHAFVFVINVDTLHKSLFNGNCHQALITWNWELIFSYFCRIIFFP